MDFVHLELNFNLTMRPCVRNYAMFLNIEYQCSTVATQVILVLFMSIKRKGWFRHGFRMAYTITPF
jgi:hypothetical protein